MSSYIEEQDTRVTTRAYCPECHPETDQIAECVTVVYCGTHALPCVPGLGLGLGSEAGGPTNVMFCNWLHRGVEPTRISPEALWVPEEGGHG